MPRLIGTPFDLDMITAFACQETGEVWPTLRKRGLPNGDMGPALHDEAQARELAIEVLIRWFDDEHGVTFDPAPTTGVH